MRILLLGEYSNVHNTLAQGLRELGHEVVVASNGDFWKDYPRDIDLKREMTPCGNISFFCRLLCALPKMRGFDVVQIINPLFLELKAERIRYIYSYLRKYNKKVILGANGMDYYWVKVNAEMMPMKYSDFNIGTKKREDEIAAGDYNDWIETPKGQLNKYIALNCDGIVAGLYEYWITYKNAEKGVFCPKLRYIPYPIHTEEYGKKEFGVGEKVKVFIGISKGRSKYKGTDIMLKAAKKLYEEMPDKIELRIAEGIPFAEYQKMMDGSDILLDQLYGYSPAMNALLAMSKGIISVGGAEPEWYELMQETEDSPSYEEDKELFQKMNVIPTEESVYEVLRNLVMNPNLVTRMKEKCVSFVSQYHDYRKVAHLYENLYKEILS